MYKSVVRGLWLLALTSVNVAFQCDVATLEAKYFTEARSGMAPRTQNFITNDMYSACFLTRTRKTGPFSRCAVEYVLDPYGHATWFLTAEGPGTECKAHCLKWTCAVSPRPGPGISQLAATGEYKIDASTSQGNVNYRPMLQASAQGVCFSSIFGQRPESSARPGTATCGVMYVVAKNTLELMAYKNGSAQAECGARCLQWHAKASLTGSNSTVATAPEGQSTTVTGPQGIQILNEFTASPGTGAQGIVSAVNTACWLSSVSSHPYSNGPEGCHVFYDPATVSWKLEAEGPRSPQMQCAARCLKWT